MSRADDPSEPTAQVTVDLTLNDQEVTRTVEAGTLLSSFLRDGEFLTGVHRGCESTRCGACTVLLNGEPVKSCNMLAAQVDGEELTTVEGLSGEDGDLHPVQESFWDTHGLQCGYCTPGMVLNAVSLLEETDDPSVTEIQERISGNICRCTGYTKIIQSVKNAAADED
jgi:carbon-monoxide dehydrogenase small subunit